MTLARVKYFISTTLSRDNGTINACHHCVPPVIWFAFFTALQQPESLRALSHSLSHRPVLCAKIECIKSSGVAIGGAKHYILKPPEWTMQVMGAKWRYLP